MDTLFIHIENYPMVLTAIIVCAIMTLAAMMHYGIKYILFRVIKTLVSTQSPQLIQRLESFNIFKSAGLFGPTLVAYLGTKYFLNLEHATHIQDLVLNVILVGLIILIFNFINRILSFVLNELTRRYSLNTALVRTFYQVIKIALSIAMAVSIISILLNKSPIVILSSLGALTAIILLVFKDSILGFVASVQVTLLGMVKEGDWIEMPKYNADGNILDINISSIRVQNWDKTITTIPTYALVSEPVKNWKGMERANVRRIKRSICIDINSITFCDQKFIEKMKSVTMLTDHLERVQDKLIGFDRSITPTQMNALNTPLLTNIGLFRAYLYAYLRNHPKIQASETLLVRQRQSNETGVPLEIYCFTNTTDWAAYEDIQSDIFDHIFASIPLFELSIIQYSGNLSSNRLT